MSVVTGSETSQYAVETENLHRSFGDFIAVRSVSLNVPRGSVFGLLGANGAGKSTMLKMLMGHLKPTSGTIRILGRQLDRDLIEIRKRVGYVAEHHYLYEWMTVEEAISFTRAFHATWDDQKSAALLKRFKLPAKKRVKELSRGNRARLGLTLALSFSPELIILDEPTTGLDPIVRRDFVEHILAEIGKEGRTVLFSSHIVEEVERVADYVGILHDGKLLVTARISALKESVRKIRCETNGMKTLDPSGLPGLLGIEPLEHEQWLTFKDFSQDTLRMLTERGIAHSDVLPMSLEDIFVDMIRAEQRLEERV
jgi:ABC-2 type transport system ATP-binding protein